MDPKYRSELNKLSERVTGVEGDIKSLRTALSGDDAVGHVGLVGRIVELSDEVRALSTSFTQIRWQQWLIIILLGGSLLGVKLPVSIPFP